MMRRATILTAAVAALLTAVPAGAMEKKTKKVARELIARHQDAIVMVEVVLKVNMTYNGRQFPEQERKLEANGTVIGADGLIVVSRAQVDPPVPKRQGLRVDISTSSVKIVLADGTEHKAKIVQTDRDLDMAFVRPLEKVKLPHVELKKTADPELLDDLVSITRLGRKANRVPGVSASRVLSIIKKPRTRYVSSGRLFQGCPVFNSAGEALGLSLHRASGGASLAVLTCEDILEVAGNVPQVKADAAGDDGDDGEEKTDKKPEEKTEEKKEEAKPAEGKAAEEEGKAGE